MLLNTPGGLIEVDYQDYKYAGTMQSIGFGIGYPLGFLAGGIRAVIENTHIGAGAIHGYEKAKLDIDSAVESQRFRRANKNEVTAIAKVAGIDTTQEHTVICKELGRRRAEARPSVPEFLRKAPTKLEKKTEILDRPTHPAIMAHEAMIG